MWRLSENVQMIGIRGGGQVHVAILGSAMEGGSKIGLFLAGRGKINFDRAEFVELFKIAENFRNDLSMLAHAAVNSFG
jgi:hypothetical protein